MNFLKTSRYLTYFVWREFCLGLPAVGLQLEALANGDALAAIVAKMLMGCLRSACKLAWSHPFAMVSNDNGSNGADSAVVRASTL